MKEYPTSDYPIEIRTAEREFLDGYRSFVSEAHLVVVNHVVHLAVIPELSTNPWPPPFPTNWDEAVSREAALGFAFATTDVTIVPSIDGGTEARTVRYAEAPEAAHTAFWIPRGRFTALQAEITALGEYRGTRSEITSKQLEWVLTEVLPKAELSDYQRTMLQLERQRAG